MVISVACIFIASIAFLFTQNACAIEIALETTKIPEGNFSILLYKPQRTELPIRENDSGITNVSYTYQSYFQPLDVSYVAGYTDWTASKQYEIKKYGSPVMGVIDDFNTAIEGVIYITQKMLGVKVRLISRHNIKYESHLGIDANFEFIVYGNSYYIRYRNYKIGYKEYFLQVVYPSQYERYANPEAYLNSFKLLR